MKLKAKLLLLGAGVLLMLLLGPNSAFLGLGLRRIPCLERFYIAHFC